MKSNLPPLRELLPTLPQDTAMALRAVALLGLPAPLLLLSPPQPPKQRPQQVPLRRQVTSGPGGAAWRGLGQPEERGHGPGHEPQLLPVPHHGGWPLPRPRRGLRHPPEGDASGDQL